MKMGRKLDSPLLKLLGKTFVKMEEKLSMVDDETKHDTPAVDGKNEKEKETDQFAEKLDNVIKEICLLHPCGKWSDWEDCDAKKNGTFGSQTRTRKCGYNSTLCISNSETSWIEKDIRLCEYSPWCPSDYKLTEDDYCVKLYADQKKTWQNAQKTCSEDGGHLISIHSDSKSRIVEAILESMNVDDIWIDGIKKSSDGDWEFLNKFAYRNWYKDQPDGTIIPQCINLYKFGKWIWLDDPCSEKYYYMSEILAST
ncbi:uncharacterized protein LOC128553160 [Mercenaria mercenaria]|uniref:uncharacterized protein LOC128553160 n=1 Tax=Mercenaria mercenaria TaxID=6596 RepID=UPI00234F0614|nr:uncharacterized protein LOC128553160 [Mercenaria mercenaria]